MGKDIFFVKGSLLIKVLVKALEVVEDGGKLPSEIGKRYLKVQGLHRLPKGPRLAKGILRFKVGKGYLMDLG